MRPRLREGDSVLVKASRGIALDRVVNALRLELGEAPLQGAVGVEELAGEPRVAALRLEPLDEFRRQRPRPGVVPRADRRPRLLPRRAG